MIRDMTELTTRQKTLLSSIVEEYVLTAKPVGSKLLAEHNDLGVSPATIRNDMKDLEDLGFITHPHTSAGRIPTEIGYRYYVQNFVNTNQQLTKSLATEINDLIATANTAHNSELTLKYIAKGLAELSSEAILVRLRDQNFYYTGISNIFAKPEFRDIDMMYALSELVDQFDEAMQQLQLENSIDILIGSDNPMSTLCSAVVTQTYSVNTQEPTIIAIFGPMRMNYQRNYQLLQHTTQLLTNI